MLHCRGLRSARGFPFTDEQRMMARTVRELLAEVCCTRAICAAAEGRDAARALPRGGHARGELGLPGMLAPEAAGGLGSARRHRADRRGDRPRGVPEPLVEHAGVAVPLLAGRGRRACAPDARAAAAGAARVSRSVYGAIPSSPGRHGRRLLLGADDELSPRPRSRVAAGRAAGERIVSGACSASNRAVCTATRIGGARGAGGDGRRSITARCFAAAQRLGLAQRMLAIAVAYASAAHAVRQADRRATRRSSTSSRVRR